MTTECPPFNTPADPSKWNDPDPTTIAEALDRIAAALGPIA